MDEAKPDGDGTEPEAGSVLSLQDALAYAVRQHRAGELDEAETIYRQILDVAPDHAGALHFYGVLKHGRGLSAEALELINRAIELAPGQAGMHNNLGNVLKEAGRPDLALAAYEAAAAMEPDDAQARHNRDETVLAIARNVESETLHRAALELDPTNRQSWSELVRILISRGQFREALAAQAREFELRADEPGIWRMRVAAHTALGENAKALPLVQAVLDRDPDNVFARHLIASLSGADVPPRASDSFVESTFDAFAETFDSQLAKLAYRAPALVGAVVREAMGEPAAALAVLDAGCGTGLCGPYLKPYAAHLAGVDLSGRMIAKAGERGGYDRLERAELTAFLLAHPAGYDLIASADTLCYFGALGEVLAAAAGALRPGGTLVFTVEKDEDGAEFRLNAHGRYSHDSAHVAGALAAAGFAPPEIREADLRMELDTKVRGFVVKASLA